MLPCSVNCDKGVCVGGGAVGGRTVELLVYIIHVSIPWKCCHKLSLKLECLVDSLFPGTVQGKRGQLCFCTMQAERHVGGKEVSYCARC